MTWICPYCGTENENEERVAMNEPKCLLCRSERIDPDVLEKARLRELKSLKVILSGEKIELQEIRDRRASVEDTLSSIKIAEADQVQEVKTREEEISKLENTPLFRKKVRHIGADQARLLPEEVVTA